MATVCGIVSVKRFTYRDDASEEWSNRYWFTQAPPTTEVGWRELADYVGFIESAVVFSTTSVVRYYGYDDTDKHAHAVFVADLTLEGAEVPGHLALTGGKAMAGDQAGLIQFKTRRFNSRGKAIYLRKYLHAGATSDTDLDKIHPTLLSSYQTYATALVDGSVPGARVLRSVTQDEQFSVVAPSSWVTTRTLKRRGKRPLPTP